MFWFEIALQWDFWPQFLSDFQILKRNLIFQRGTAGHIWLGQQKNAQKYVQKFAQKSAHKSTQTSAQKSAPKSFQKSTKKTVQKKSFICFFCKLYWLITYKNFFSQTRYIEKHEVSQEGKATPNDKQ